MKLSRFCIERPVFASVLSFVLILIGIMGFINLHTRFFPRFEPHIVSIATSYPGASAKLIETSITTPLERSISGIEGIDTISSVSSQGASNIKVLLETGVNSYDITNKIRDQIENATNTLPTNLQPPVITSGHADMDLMDVGFSIDDNKLSFLRDYLDRYVITRIEQVDGVSEVDVLGANQYAIRITLHPNKMTARNVTINAISQAITSNNLELPAGYIQSQTMNFPITAKTNLKTPQDFGDILIQENNGNPVYLKDVATVSLGKNTAPQSIVKINGKPAILLSIYNTDESNPINVSTHIQQLLSRMKSQLPQDMHAQITFDQASYMKASIAEVYKSIAMAVLFVGIIIFFTLGKIRSSLIPIATIPVCLIATFGFMYFLGFSINLITLLALVLSIGLVVDDAIVVLENIHRHMEAGLTRMQAAIKGAEEIMMPVIAMTLTLAAVYAPIGLITGPAAHIFASFAFTLATAVIISGFVALTLSPMMCSKLLSAPSEKKSNFENRIEHFLHALTTRYKTLLTKALAHRLKIIIITVFCVIGGFYFAGTLPKTFIPKEDMGFLVSLLHSETGTNDTFAQQQLNQLDQIIAQNKNVMTNVSLSFDQASSSENNMIFSTLAPYSKRSESADAIADHINAKLKQVPGLHAVTFAPAFGGSPLSEVSFYIMAPESYQFLYQTSQTLIAKLQSYPGLLNINTNISFDNQQYNLTINRALASQLQVSAQSIDQTLAAFLGGETVSTYALNGQSYDVDIQAAKPYLQSLDAIKQLTVPSATGTLIPLQNLITITPVQTQTNLYHYNQLRAAQIYAEIAPGYSLGDVVSYLQTALPKILPSDVKYSFSGRAKNIVDSSNDMSLIFVLAFAFIYLVLSAQFESFLDPFVILLAVPLSIIGALICLKSLNGSINMYTMIALVTLVGLIAKHGILITQFANTLHREGKSAKDALIEAASIRLRPILMTTVAMIAGALPLLLASGASAVSRREVGVVFVGGLAFGTFFSLILVPIAYSYFAQLKTFVKAKTSHH